MPRKKSDTKEPWEGDSSDDNTWEPEENPEGTDAAAAPSFEDSRQKKDRETLAATTPSDAVEENVASRKRGRAKKKKVEEIEKPRGIDRGLQPEKILAAQLYNSSLYFLVKWHGCMELDVVPSKDLNQSFPDFVIQYYESCVPFSVRHKIGRVPREAPELPPPEVPVEPMDVSQNLEPPQTENAEPPVEPSLPDLPEIPNMAMPEAAAEESQPMEVPVN